MWSPFVNAVISHLGNKIAGRFPKSNERYIVVDNNIKSDIYNMYVIVSLLKLISIIPLSYMSYS